jgi:2-oxoglutarate dehydrogenase E2 component (dihydrolipoamide succinyltransferase)
MAILEVKVPQLSESVAEATLLQWHKKPGEPVVLDEALIDIETDKVVLELPSPGAGVMTDILKGDGSTVVSGETIARIDTEARATAPTAAALTSAAAEPPRPGALALAAADTAMPAGDHAPIAQTETSAKDSHAAKGDVINLRERKAGPAMASSAVARPALQSVAVPLGTGLANRPEQRVPMSRLRARIAERLLESQATNAILTTFNEVNMQPVMDLRNKYRDRFEKAHGVKLGFMSFFVKAVVAALEKFPIINASVDGNDIVYHRYIDIGIAVGSPRGLVVPILRNADQLSIADIERKIVEFGVKARDGKLTLDDLSGGTFSISNGGVFGSMLSTPIINPPQSAILGIHATKERAVVENGQIVIRPMNYLALSYDHRIIDGREAVLGLVAMKDVLEDPERLLLNL